MIDTHYIKILMVWEKLSSDERVHQISKVSGGKYTSAHAKIILAIKKDFGNPNFFTLRKKEILLHKRTGGFGD